MTNGSLDVEDKSACVSADSGENMSSSLPGWALAGGHLPAHDEDQDPPGCSPISFSDKSAS